MRTGRALLLPALAMIACGSPAPPSSPEPPPAAEPTGTEVAEAPTPERVAPEPDATKRCKQGGGVPAAEVNEINRAHSGAIGACLLDSDRAQVRIDLVIGPAGSVAEVSTDAEDGGSMAGCLRSALAAAEFSPRRCATHASFTMMVPAEEEPDPAAQTAPVAR